MKTKPFSGDPGTMALAGGIPCRIGLIYEDEETRDWCMELCDRLVGRWWRELDLELLWWKLHLLNDPALMNLAIQETSAVDVMVFSLPPRAELPEEARGFLESWLKQRCPTEAVLVALENRRPNPGVDLPAACDYLEQAARRSGLDFLRCDLQSSELTLFQEVMSGRAQQVTSVLQKILNQSPPPGHWGINE